LTVALVRRLAGMLIGLQIEAAASVVPGPGQAALWGARTWHTLLTSGDHHHQRSPLCSIRAVFASPRANRQRQHSPVMSNWRTPVLTNPWSQVRP
jgi:hypothetical protein